MTAEGTRPLLRAAVAVCVGGIAFAILGPSWAPVVSYHVGELVTVAALVTAATTRSGGERRAWVLIASGVTCFAAGDVLNTAARSLVDGVGTAPSPFEPLYLAMYPFLAVGLRALVRHRAPDGDRGAVLDAAIFTVGIAAVVWVTSFAPQAGDPEASGMRQALLLAYPTLDVILLASTSLLAFRVRPLTARLTVLVAAMAVLLATDVAYVVAVRQDTHTSQDPAAFGWWAMMALLAVAAWLPASGQTPTRTAGDLALPGRLRLAALALTSMLVPLVGVLSGGSTRDRLLDVVAAVLSLLVFVRLSGLVRALVASREEVALLHQQREERRFRSLVQNAADIVLVLDADRRVTYASPSAERLLGVDPVDMDRETLVGLIHRGDQAAVAACLSRSAQLPGPGDLPAAVTLRLRDASGAWRHLEVLATDLSADGDVGGVVLNIRDVTERASLEHQLRRLAMHDPLTGLANRVMFAELVQEALDRAGSDRDGVAVLFCDVDDFKTVNDSLGHDTGDALLLALARRLDACLGAGDVAARLGGDEFGVLLSSTCAPGAAEAAADALIAALRDPVDLDGTEIAPSVSIGIAVGGTTPAEMLRNADAAMYEAKRAGAGRWRRWSPALHHRALSRLRLTTDLGAALERGEFSLDYQPVVDLADRRIRGVEALVRWDHPDRGRIPPLEFIPLAEETGAITALGAWVLTEACRQLAEWQRDLPGAPDVVHVNVSARELHATTFPRTVERALAAAGLPPEALVLELTESVLLEDPEGAASTFRMLRQLGIGIAIDDFGTGYSSLSYLRNLPVDVLKIDRAFVQDLGHGLPDRTVARGIVDLARALGVRTVAEGVEEESQLADLRSLGCHEAQGYHLGHPVPADGIAAMLRALATPVASGG